MKIFNHCLIRKFFTYRNVLNLIGANSTETDPDAENPVVIDMPEHNNGILGGTMRLGKRVTLFGHGNSVVSKYETEGWWHLR
jgi:CTP synthase (UTP-ammonia lyase)